MSKYILGLMMTFMVIIICFFIFTHLKSSNRKNKAIDVHFHEAQHQYEGKAEVIIPNALDSLAGFLKSYKEGNEDGLLHVIQLYLYGLHPEYGPDKLTGLKLMKRISADGHFSQRMKMVCKMFEEDTSVLIYTDIDSYNPEYKRLPTNILDVIDEIIDHQLKNKIEIIHCSMNVSHKTIQSPVVVIDEGNFDFDDINMFEELRNEHTNVNIQHNNVIIHNDSQNVHNHSVQNISKTIIDAMDNNINSFDDNSLIFLRELKKYHQTISKHEIAKIMLVLNSMTDTFHSKYNKSEKDIFNLTFERIMNKTNQDEKENLFIMFAQNIASAVEYGIVVCSTGKITRMLSTFDVIDEALPDLKPDWVIREEIGNLASKIRTEVLNECTDEEREAYTEYDEQVDKKELYEKTADKMKSRLMDECYDSYVKTKNMSKTAMDIILIDYIEAF